MLKFKIMAVAGLAAFLVGNIGSEAHAVTYGDGDIVGGNDCAGVLGTPPNCVLNGSSMIVKFDFNDDGTMEPPEFGNFATIDGSEFMISFDMGGMSSGSWTYTPGVGDPSITGWTVKAGPQFKVFLGTGLSGFWDTPDGKDISHITFFNGPPPNPIPLPAAAWLLLSGIGGLGVMGWRKQRAAA